MTRRGRTVSMGDLVVMAHSQAALLMRDPGVASMLAAWVVRRVLSSEANRGAAAELVRLTEEHSPAMRKAG